MRKFFITLFATLLLTSFATVPVFASWAYSKTQYLDKEAFKVYAEIANYSSYSIASSIYDGTNVQIYIKNITTYGPNRTEIDSHTIGYEGGTIHARVAPGTGYYLWKCVANGNVKNGNGDTVILSVSVED